MTENYKKFRSRLMHSNGTSSYETLIIILPSVCYITVTIILISLLRTFYTKNAIIQHIIEFSILIVPLILNMTVLADQILIISLTSLIVGLVLLILVHNMKQMPKKSISPINPQSYLTNARALVSVLSVAAILAVDFQIFPRRFAKTESFGYSLMDVGVGLYVFASAIVDDGKKDTLKSLKGVVPLLIIGVARYFLTQKIDYHVPVSEYGLHWNFFITLAITKIFVTLIFGIIDVQFIVINGMLLLFSHEILLESGLKNFVLSDIKRNTFATANREGLVSALGYVSLYLLSSYIGYFLKLKKISQENRNRTLMKMFLVWFSCLVASLLFEHYFGISRKLVNSAYCFWIMFIGTLMCFLFYLADYMLKSVLRNKLVNCVYSPLILEAINYNVLAYFLVANLLTGLINIICDTLKVGTVISLSIISFYMFVNCTVVCVLYKRKIKLKL